MNKHTLFTLFVAVLAAFGATTTHARTGGPDAFGYSFIDSLEPAGPTYNFEDISGGSALALADEEMSGAVPIGFTFNYYGTPYTDAYISSNGFISFLSGQNCCTADFEGEPIPMAGDPDAIIVAWWIDLDPSAGGNVYTQTTGTAPNRVFIVSFTDVPYFNRPEVVQFQFKLFEGSNTIEVHYDKVENRGISGQAGATAGIEDQAGTVGLQYTNDEDLITPVAVRYSLPAPPDCGLEVTKSCFIEPPPAADFACSKPIDEITMIWDGVAEPVRIKAYKGSTSAALLLDTGAISASNPGVMIGDEVSVNGYAGSSNDVYWEIFDASNNLLGTSKFHLSCSDDDMDGETDDPLFPQDCGKREGNGKKSSGGLINDWLLEGMVDTVGTLDCTPDAPNPGPGGTPVTECEFIGQSVECTKRPTSISFRYHAGDDCMDSSNNQGSSKWSCTDFGITPDPAHITIGKDGGSIVVDDLNVTDGEVLVGDKGSSYDSEILILVRNTMGGTMQEIRMHSSCSQELKIGDRFGAIEIVGFTNEEQGTVTGGGADVIYSYTIGNKGLVPFLVTSEDDKLGPVPAAPGIVLPEIGVPGQLLLVPGQVYSYEATALVDVTTTNTLTSTAINDFGVCTREASATVTIAGAGAGPGPGPGACSVSAANSLKIKKKKLEWKITNTGSAAAVIESIDLSWPSVNGDLKKIKLGGDALAKKVKRPGSGKVSISSFKGSTKKRTIKVGDTDTLKLDFKKNADEDPGKYAITVNFVGGCSADF